MPAYIVAEVNVTDPEPFKRYQALAPAVIGKHGGDCPARGGRTVTPEDGWQAIAARAGAAYLKMVGVEGT